MNTPGFFALHRRFLSPCLAVLCLLLAPAAANATPVTYEFTVTATKGPLSGTISHGTFSYDSDSVTPGTYNLAVNLLTTLDFIWNGITYNAATTNTGSLLFDEAGKLDGFLIGNNCFSGGCSVFWNSDGWLANGEQGSFIYSTPGVGVWLDGHVTFSPASVSVPEPADLLGLFGFGMLLIGALAGMRRRAGPAKT